MHPKHKEKGVKCFDCNKFDHISKKCPIKVEKANVRQMVVKNSMK